MKKAKIILTLIAIFAIVGGTYAFKANRGAFCWCRVATTVPCLDLYLNGTYTPNPAGLLFCGPDQQHCDVRANIIYKL